MDTIKTLSELMSPSALKLLSASGNALVKEIGLDVIKGVIFDVLIGKNLRDSTEMLTRRRITALNLALVNLFLKGISLSDNFIEQLPYLASEILQNRKIDKAERWLAQWTLGLNDKAFQNVLRDNPNLIEEYRDRYIQTCQDIINNDAQNYGQLIGNIQIGKELKSEINWLMLVYLLNTVGAQTLAIRGSEKSAYGKLFEKLILGAVLTILGFTYITYPPDEFNQVFWLSSREDQRESDATALYKAGYGVRFDIGFIGRGNSEISLDKVTRFQREIELGNHKFYLATIIIVDRIGDKSIIQKIAPKVKGKIIQMSANYWIQHLAESLQEVFTEYNHPLISMEESELENYLRHQLNQINLTQFIS